MPLFEYSQALGASIRFDTGSKKRPEYRYPAHPLLGFNTTDQASIRYALLRDVVDDL
ncbi:hypothetical protein [Collimonas sp.]|jgi:hypothetical protein|uniref:hypothetical protein n=1 Tax=Collimonas sp. TaxID=1963772 RepID=UPI002C12F0F6|nr:hypothetical protein [Collimonas sp.]HWW06381.1 hypothetical protein [Collimonas sp.]